MGKTKGQTVIIRTYSAGVHFGVIVERYGKEVQPADARRIWSWKGANTLNEIALHGLKKGCRISEPVPTITLLEAIEIIPCLPEAVEALEAVGWS